MRRVTEVIRISDLPIGLATDVYTSCSGSVAEVGEVARRIVCAICERAWKCAGRVYPRGRLNAFNGKRVGKRVEWRSVYIYIYIRARWWSWGNVTRRLAEARWCSGPSCRQGFCLMYIYNRFFRSAHTSPSSCRCRSAFVLHKLFSGRLTRNLVCEGAAALSLSLSRCTYRCFCSRYVSARVVYVTPGRQVC